MGKWIRSRGINGEYGYINTTTGLFRTTLPNSAEEAKFDRTEGKRRNYSDEQIKKVVNKPTLTVDKNGGQ